MMEGENIIGCRMGGQSVTLEPGGQFELSGAPLDSIHKTCAEVNGHLYQAKAIAEEMGVGFLGTGFDPKWKVEEVPVMPKGRYKLMKEYMPTVGTMGLDMMFRSCTVQVNLDFGSEADMVEKFRIGLALQVLPGITANPFSVIFRPSALIVTIISIIIIINSIIIINIIIIIINIII